MRKIKDCNGNDVSIGSKVCIQLPQSTTVGRLDYLDDGEVGVVINDDYQFTLAEILTQHAVMTVIDAKEQSTKLN